MGLTKTLTEMWNFIKDASILQGSCSGILALTHTHKEIYEGRFYEVRQSTTDLDTNAITVSFTTPPNKAVCARIQAKATGQAVLEFREAPTGGVAGGSDKAPIAHNRQLASSKPSCLISTSASASGYVTIGASAGTGGTVLLEENFGTGKNESGEGGDENEWLLQMNTKYIIYMYSSTNSIVASLVINVAEFLCL